MSTICPADGNACPDDLCRGCGVCSINGRSLLDRCPRCGSTFSIDDGIDCLCDDGGVADLDHEDEEHDCGEDTCVCREEDR